MKAVISRTSSVSGMTTPAMLSVAVVDMCNSWNQRRIGLYAPSFGSRHGDNSGAGLLSFPIVTAAIGDVATAAMQPTYLLASICPGAGRACPVQSSKDAFRGTKFFG